MGQRLRSIVRSALSLALTAGLAFSSVPAFAEPAAAAEPLTGGSNSLEAFSNADVVPGEVVVVFEDGVSAD